ncbi:MAG: DUF669 domain-containing protein, partial [Deltaproteobacteria bacterium]|nr:DUF669 domain-containing protein [Deltaproteobacteria bacterium]
MDLNQVSMNTNLENVPDEIGAVPAGDYIAALVEVEPYENSNTGGWRFTYEILEGDFIGRKLFDTIVTDGSEKAVSYGLYKMKELARAVGSHNPEYITNAGELQGEFIARVEVQEKGEFKGRNQVTKRLALETNAPASPPPPAQAPASPPARGAAPARTIRQGHGAPPAQAPPATTAQDGQGLPPGVFLLDYPGARKLNHLGREVRIVNERYVAQLPGVRRLRRQNKRRPEGHRRRTRGHKNGSLEEGLAPQDVQAPVAVD